MKKWPEQDQKPHKNHLFEFDVEENHPVKDEKVQSGKAKPNLPGHQPGNPQEFWEQIGADLFDYIEKLNGLLLKYKTTEEGEALYTKCANDAKAYIDKGGPEGSPFKSLAVEVVETGGFVVAFRMVGDGPKKKSNPDPGTTGKKPVLDYSSSSYYSVYPTDCCPP